MIKRLSSVISDFVILLLTGGLLLLFKDSLLHEGVWLYDAAWLVCVIAVIATFLLRPRKSNGVVSFPEDQAKRIEKALPHDAIKIHQAWLIQSLEKCYRASHKKCSKEALFHLAKTLADTLVITFNRLPKDVLYQILEERNKDNAAVALIFFTSIIRVLNTNVADAIFNKPIVGYRDVFTRITLEEAKTFLFREHYRLYELGALLEGRWLALHFNHDIEPVLKSALAPDLLEDKSRAAPTKPFDVEKTEPDTAHKVNEVSEKQRDIHRKDDATEIPVMNAANLLEATVQNSLYAEPTTISERETPLKVSKFFKWLQRQIKRKPINKDPYFYQRGTQYGKEPLFLSDRALADFFKKTHISCDEIKTLLTAQGYSDGRSYRLKTEGPSVVSLMAIHVNFDVVCLHELSGTIEVAP